MTRKENESIRFKKVNYKLFKINPNDPDVTYFGFILVSWPDFGRGSFIYYKARIKDYWVCFANIYPELSHKEIFEELKDLASIRRPCQDEWIVNLYPFRKNEDDIDDRVLHIACWKKKSTMDALIRKTLEKAK